MFRGPDMFALCRPMLLSTLVCYYLGVFGESFITVRKSSDLGKCRLLQDQDNFGQILVFSQAVFCFLKFIYIFHNYAEFLKPSKHNQGVLLGIESPKMEALYLELFGICTDSLIVLH